MKPSIVNLIDLHKTFGSQHVLRGVDWNIAPGQVIGLLGQRRAFPQRPLQRRRDQRRHLVALEGPQRDFRHR